MLILHKGLKNSGRGTERVCEQAQRALLRLGYVVRINEYRGSYIKGVLAEWLGIGIVLSGRNITISANGRVSPLKVVLRERFSLIVLDWMNYIGNPSNLKCGPRQLASRLHHTAMSRLCLPYSESIFTISTKVKLETEKRLNKWGRKNPVFLLQPYGSFAVEEEHREVEKDKSGDWAIWTTGLTENKAYERGNRFLEELELDIVYRVVGVRKSQVRGGDMFDLSERRYCDDEMVAMYSYATVSFCLSRDEGFGLPFLDALLFGVPVVSTDLATHKEIASYVGCIGFEMGLAAPQIWWLENSDVLNVSKELREWCDNLSRGKDIKRGEREGRYKYMNNILKERFKIQLARGLTAEV